MNKIEKYVYGLVGVARKANVKLSFDAKELIDELVDASYKNNVLENLVNICDVSSNALNIGEILSEGDYEEDYQIETYTKYNSDGERFDTEEEYEEYLQELTFSEFEYYSSDIKTEYVIIDSNNNNYFLDEFETFEEAQEELNNFKRALSEEEVSGYKIKIYSHCDILDNTNFIVDTIDDFIEAKEMEERAIERIAELRDEFIEEQEQWDDLDSEYDEVYYNVVRNFGDEANPESAKKAGLGVIYLPKLDESFLFLQGCGMDLSFCFAKYLAYEYGALTEEYLSKLEWTKSNSSETEFETILFRLGVDVERLSK